MLISSLNYGENNTLMAENTKNTDDSEYVPRARIKTARKDRRRDMPQGLWTKCIECSDIVYNKVLDENQHVCPKCDYHFTLGAYQRVETLVDSKSFKETDPYLKATDPLKFKGPKSYKEKIEAERKRTGMIDAVVTGLGKIDGQRIALGVTDSRFIMGSMGSVVGERLTRVIEAATQKKLPVIIVSGSGGGARMYEGVLSLMQMAKTSAALARHHAAGLLFVSVLTNPTMAGIMASYASLGDLIVAEPKALIGFTGPRVIEQTIRQKLPEGFQTSEFLLEHGWLDQVVHRNDLKDELSFYIKMFKNESHDARQVNSKKIAKVTGATRQTTERREAISSTAANNHNNSKSKQKK
ncbi:MAG: acetyl-CoA carboxylase carboxyl transferase subunit beta [Candidatus Omnitrophota bacterium]|jgi:acetyl-CoA carboxylase carboxyl transferase subunit beta